MWPGQQPSGGEQNSQDRHVNPYQQPNPYQQQPQQPGQAPWAAPTVPMGTPPPPRGGGRRTTVIAVAAATAVVITAAATGFLVLGGDKDDSADPKRSESSSSPGTGPTRSGGDDAARGGNQPEPVVPGWKVVVNAKRGIAFDVPAEWDRKSQDWATYVADNRDPEEKPLIGFAAPAMLKEKWCQSDDNLDGTKEDSALASAGSRRENGARSAEDAARTNVSLWVYGAYAQPDKKKVKAGAAEPYTTTSGIKGSVVTAMSVGVEKKGKCDTDGKATTFAFKDPKGDFVSWTFLGAKGVQEEVPDATVRKILSTVRLADGPPTS